MPTCNKGGVVITPPTRMSENHYALARLDPRTFLL
jgi:hypothetical protein